MWNQENTEKLIELVHKDTQIWRDRRNESDENWIPIARECGVSVPEAMKKWRNIKASFYYSQRSKTTGKYRKYKTSYSVHREKLQFLQVMQKKILTEEGAVGEDSNCHNRPTLSTQPNLEDAIAVDETQAKNPICRLCLQSKESSLMKFFPEMHYKKIPYHNIYFDLVGITLTECRENKSWICKKCEKDMIKAYEFRERCLASEMKLKEVTDPSGISSVFIRSTEENNYVLEKMPEIKTEIDYEDLIETTNTIMETDAKDAPATEGEYIECRKCNGMIKIEDLFKKHTCLPPQCNTNDIKSEELEDMDDAIMEEPQIEIPKPQVTKSRKKTSFTCEICGKKLANNNAYRNHKYSHEKAFVCEHCGKRFACWATRRTHILKIHLKKKLCHCPVCNKGFYKVYHMKLHMQEHDNENPGYQCAVCGKMSATKPRLEKHMASHGDATKCKICNKIMKNGRSLLQHMRIHKEKKNYICPVCSKGFICNFSLKTHVRKLHPDDVHLLPPDGTIVNRSYLRRLQEEEEEDLARIQTSNK